MFSPARSLSVAVATALIPHAAFACACGCGIFDVGDGTIAPVGSDSGFSVSFRFARLVQDQNREHGSRANSDDNNDKKIDTNFYTAGVEYMIDRKWTVMAELPVYQRAFTSTDDGTYAGPPGTIDTRRLTALGDLSMRALYTGFSPDLSSGIGIGVKLPTGRFHSPAGPRGGAGFDRDTLPGTGSTDLLANGYHVGKLAGRIAWFVQAQYQFAVATKQGYRPGNEFDGALGVSYDLGTVAKGVSATPTLQLLGSARAHDTGDNANPQNSGYRRLLIAPGLKVNLSRKLAIYGDIEFPIAQYVRASPPPPASDASGQLVAPAQFKIQVDYGF